MAEDGVFHNPFEGLSKKKRLILHAYVDALANNPDITHIIYVATTNNGLTIGTGLYGEVSEETRRIIDRAQATIQRRFNNGIPMAFIFSILPYSY